MAKAKPRGKPFTAGVSGNPSGKPPLPPEIREFRKTSYVEFLSHLQKYGGMSTKELNADLARDEVTQFEKICGKIVGLAGEGDKDARRDLLDRLWGKVKEQKEELTDATRPPQVIITLPDNGRGVNIQQLEGTASDNNDL